MLRRNIFLQENFISNIMSIIFNPDYAVDIVTGFLKPQLAATVESGFNCQTFLKQRKKYFYIGVKIIRIPINYYYGKKYY